MATHFDDGRRCTCVETRYLVGDALRPHRARSKDAFECPVRRSVRFRVRSEDVLDALAADQASLDKAITAAVGGTDVPARQAALRVWEALLAFAARPLAVPRSAATRTTTCCTCMATPPAEPRLHR